ncbi:hypothetical protein OLMES_5511 [Oleiphilus messinensis]|uniref:Lipoprotein n=1 Tax=Oleiphilus messinensis TaxID=141451 RepID=A0A1Y0IG77_9GAMM|nr:hypothetical protein [Oleiphilus messinensis]ARU59491.1 hypothetical protein OLMES_5511 [Oleiphilus messinensis]
MKASKFCSQLLPSMVIALSLVGCGSDSDSPTSNNDGNTSVPDDNSSSSEGALYLVKSTSWTTDDGIAMHFVTDSLDENTVFNEADALALEGYLGVALPEGDNPDNAFFVGLNPEPVFQRYVVSDDGEITLDKEIDFTNQGVSNGRNLMRASKIMSPTKGYIVDPNSLQIIIFNPTEMTVTGTISLADLDEPTLPNRWSIFPTTDGDRFVAVITYYEADWSNAAHSKLVIVDSTTDTVTSDTSTECGGVSASAKDAEGNIYFASHDEVALGFHQGDLSFPPCVIRVLSGTNEWDDSYVMNMQNLTNDARLAMATMSGMGNTGYTLILSEAAQAEIDSSTTARSLIRDVWEFHSFDLTDDSATATKVENVLPTISRVQYGTLDHAELGDISWMLRTDQTAAETIIYNSTDPANWSTLTTVPGQMELVGRLK